MKKIHEAEEVARKLKNSLRFSGTQTEKDLANKIYNQVCGLIAEPVGTTVNYTDIEFKGRVLLRNTKGYNNLFTNILHPFIGVAIKITEEAKPQITIYTDAAFDMLPVAIQNFLIEAEIKYASEGYRHEKNRQSYGYNHIDDMIVEKHGAEYVIKRLEWINYHLRHIMKNDMITERLNRLKFKHPIL